MIGVGAVCRGGCKAGSAHYTACVASHVKTPKIETSGGSLN